MAEVSGTIVGVIALRRANIKWLKEVRRSFRTLLVIQAPESDAYAEASDFSMACPTGLGFSPARRLSMVICGQLDSECVVTDGDGAFTPPSIVRLAGALRDRRIDVAIALKSNAKMVLDYEGAKIDRLQLEEFENFCVRRLLRRRLPRGFAVMAGAYAYRSNILPKILPTRNDAADWEITVRALRSTRHTFVPTRLDRKVQERTTFGFEQIRRTFAVERELVGRPLSPLLTEYLRLNTVGAAETRALRQLVRLADNTDSQGRPRA